MTDAEAVVRIVTGLYFWAFILLSPLLMISLLIIGANKLYRSLKNG